MFVIRSYDMNHLKNMWFLVSTVASITKGLIRVMDSMSATY